MRSLTPINPDPNHSPNGMLFAPAVVVAQCPPTQGDTVHAASVWLRSPNCKPEPSRSSGHGIKRYESSLAAAFRLLFTRRGTDVSRNLHHNSRSSRRKPKRGFGWRLIKWTGLLLLVAAGLLCLKPRAIPRPSPGLRSARATPASSSAANVQLFASEPVSASAGRYSVIPGGVHSEKQLARVLATDPVVARHYANFDLHKLRFFRLRRGREAYVSYRLGNLIFWTSRKIRLFAGETLLTDGTHLARARCGNRVSFTPEQPTTSWQPSPLALSLPILHLAPASASLPPLSPPAVHVLSADGPTPSSGVLPIFPIFFLPPGGGSGGGTPVTPATPVAPLPTPEPATLLLFASGLALLAARYLWYRRRHC